ncbi:hypothetical protein EB093_01115 [bacterium]|nr:hypothetical protein [bacterium]
MRLIIGIGMSIGVVCGSVFADPIRVAVAVKPSSVRVGETLEYRLTVTGPDLAAMPPLQLPQFNYFKVGPSKEETSYKLVNGTMQITKTRVMTLTASREGSARLDPVAVTVGKKVIKSNAVVVEISSDAHASGDLIGTEVILRSEVSSQKVKVGQPIIYRLRVYRQSMFKHPPTVREASYQGFFSNVEIPDKKPKKTLINGQVMYGSDAVKRILYASQPGKLLIQNASLSYKPNPPYGDVIVKTATPVEIQVDPLPSPAPAGFDGAVGDFQIIAPTIQLNGTQFSPVAIEFYVSGTGNLESVLGAVIPKVDGVTLSKTSVATVDTANRQVRKIVVTAIPQVSGEIRIPPVTLVAFSIKRQAYVTIQSRAVMLKVAQGTSGSQLLDRANRRPTSPVRRVNDTDGGVDVARWLIGVLAAGNVLCFLAVGLIGFGRWRELHWGASRRRRVACDRAIRTIEHLEKSINADTVDQLFKVGRSALSDLVGQSLDGLSGMALGDTLHRLGFNDMMVAHTVRWWSDMEALVYQPELPTIPEARHKIQETIEWLTVIRPFGDSSL